MQSSLPTCDLNLDGTGTCPHHAPHYAGATFQYHCEECEYPRGYNFAEALYKHETSHRLDISYWETEYKKYEDRIGGSTHYYWSGYIEFIMERLREASQLQRDHESVLIAQEKLSLELGPREFTLTYSPSWYDTDADAQRAMKLALERLTKYYKNEIIEFHAVGEYTNSGASHIHAWYHLTGGRKITDKNFKRAYPRWNPKKKLGRGFEGGHHENIRRTADFAGYIEKHLEEAWIIVDINNGHHEEESTHASSPRSTSSSRSSSP